MQDDKRNELYEKLYFHEVDARDRVIVRLQIPLALLFSVLSIIAVLLKGVSELGFDYKYVPFYIAFAFSLVFFSLSVAYFVRAFFNHEYAFMPPSDEIEDYRKKLIEHYEPYEDADKNVGRQFNDFIYDNFNRCTSKNIIINDLRSYWIHVCNRYLLLTSVPLLVSFLIFTFTDMSDEKEKLHKIELNKPITISNLEHPIEIQGELNSTTLEVDFSNDVKEMISVRRKKERGTTETATATAP